MEIMGFSGSNKAFEGQWLPGSVNHTSPLG